MNESYGVKVVYRWRAGDQTFYEEKILHFEAESFDQAYEKAEKFARINCIETEHKNPKGQRVWIDKFYLLDCYMTYEEEIYSRIFKNPFGNDEEKMLDFLNCHSSVEEMYPLRNAELN